MESNQSINRSINQLACLLKLWSQPFCCLFLSQAREMSNHTYQGVFERRKRIDFYRNCLSTIHRFHYLFRLLTKIHKNIRVRRVHELMPDYGRLKQLVGPSPPKVLQDVLDEVERKLTGLRQSMREELEAMPGRIERQVVLAHDLSELGDPGDPGWECLEKFKAYTIGKMFEIYSHHFKNPSGAVAEVKRSLRDDDADVRMQLEFKVCVLLWLIDWSTWIRR